MTTTPSAPRAVSRVLAVGLAGAAGLGADVALDPAHRHVPMCPFRALTGWQCPLCGGLRCADALVHGQWTAALHDNVVLVAALPLIGWLWIDAARRARGARPQRQIGRAQVFAIAVVLAAFTVVRNLPALAMLRP